MKAFTIRDEFEMLAETVRLDPKDTYDEFVSSCLRYSASRVLIFSN